MKAGVQKKAGYGRERELFQKFKVEKFLGKGSYGSVYRVKRLSDGLVYAVKELDVSKMSQVEKMDAVNEIRLLASIKHPNVVGADHRQALCLKLSPCGLSQIFHQVKYHEAFIDGHWLCIIMEYATNGDLARFIKKGADIKKPFPEDIIWKFFIQVCLGVQILHQNQIIHRDIKPMNVFVGDNDVVKVGDLGIAKKLKGGLAHTQIGTPHYMPPEIWKNRPYSSACDLWSLGCLLYEMMTYRVPFEARSINELRLKVSSGRYSPLPVGMYSKELTTLCQSLLDLTPQKRPPLDKILKSSIVTGKLHLLPKEIPLLKEDEGAKVINTIKVPRDIKQLKGKLPPAQYKSDSQLPAVKAPGEISGADGARKISFA